MFTISTTLWALDITDFLRGLHKILILTDGTTTQRNADYLIELNPRVIVQTTLFSIEDASSPSAKCFGGEND
ncbi:hypothetical protein HHX47_DHR1001309 [Lentinula edodes]|nr:hypothetical protein HHX47_DHR1001309 [Lentinula edodes]